MTKTLRAPILLLLAAGSALVLFPVAVLELENGDRGNLARFRLGRDGRFSVISRHSIFDQPVTEEFSAGPRGDLVLTGVRSPSGAVLEYFGFEDTREHHPMARAMGTIVFRVAAGEPQCLEIGGRRVSFRSLGAPGDRITARAAQVPAWRLVAGAARREFR